MEQQETNEGCHDSENRNRHRDQQRRSGSERAQHEEGHGIDHRIQECRGESVHEAVTADSGDELRNSQDHRRRDDHVVGEGNETGH